MKFLPSMQFESKFDTGKDEFRLALEELAGSNGGMLDSILLSAEGRLPLTFEFLGMNGRLQFIGVQRVHFVSLTGHCHSLYSFSL